MIGTFLENNNKYNLQIKFQPRRDPEYKLNKKNIPSEEAMKYLNHFQYFLIESNNIHLPSLIASILENGALLPLDNKRSKQSESLKKLEEFITASKRAISDIESKINECLKNLTDFDGILQNKKLKIEFAEFDKLRDAIKTMTSITLHDGNTHGIASKGSGAQRAVFMALMQYISEHTKRKIIWGIDEPEAFLQPKLQKKVHELFKSLVKTNKRKIVLTTHSQHLTIG